MARAKARGGSKAKKAGGAAKPQTRRFILLPPRGLRPHTPEMSKAVGGFLRSMATALVAGPRASFAPEDTPRAKVTVIDSIREDGAKLVEGSLAAIQELRAAQPGVRIVPEIFYRPARFLPTVAAPPPRARPRKATTKAAAVAVAAARKIVLSVVAKGSGASVPGATLS